MRTKSDLTFSCFELTFGPVKLQRKTIVFVCVGRGGGSIIKNPPIINPPLHVSGADIVLCFNQKTRENLHKSMFFDAFLWDLWGLFTKTPKNWGQNVFSCAFIESFPD